MWKRIGAAGVCLLLLCNVLCMALCPVLGLEYEMRNKGLWLLCVTIALFALLLRGGDSGFRLTMLPLLCLGLFVLFIGASDIRFCEYMLMLADLALAAALFFRAGAGKWAKAVAGNLSALLVFPVLLFIGLAFIFGDFGYTTAMSSTSPGGTYHIDVRIVDEGALGGRTFYALYPSGAPVDLPFGTLGRPLASFQDGWIDPADLKITWQDESTPVVNHHIWHWQKEN